MIDLTKKPIEQLREELITALKSHDWYYDRSDDARSFHAGRVSEDRILSLVRQVPDGNELYEKHNPWLAVRS